MKKIWLILICLGLAAAMVVGCGGCGEDVVEPTYEETEESGEEYEPAERSEPSFESCLDEWVTATAFDRVGWEEWAISVDIPANWESYMYDTGDPDSYFSISGYGIEIIIWWSPLSDLAFYAGLEYHANSWGRFEFDDGNIGYMVEYDDSILWYHITGHDIGISLNHGGDRAIFADDEELILRIVRSVRR